MDKQAFAGSINPKIIISVYKWYYNNFPLSRYFLGFNAYSYWILQKDRKTEGKKEVLHYSVVEVKKRQSLFVFCLARGDHFILVLNVVLLLMVFLWFHMVQLDQQVVDHCSQYTPHHRTNNWDPPPAASGSEHTGPHTTQWLNVLPIQDYLLPPTGLKRSWSKQRGSLCLCSVFHQRKTLDSSFLLQQI